MTANLAAGDDWPDYVQLEITSPSRPPTLFAKWKPATPHYRNLLARDALLNPGDIAALDHAVISWQAEALARAEAEAAAEEAGGSAPQFISVVAHTLAPNSEQTFPVEPAKFADFLRQKKPPQTFLKWDAKNALAILDVDWHDPQGRSRVTNADIEGIMRDLSPSPIFSHLTSNGFHAGYIALAGFDADELASAAAADVSRIPLVAQTRAGVEVIAKTRHWNSEHAGKSYPGPIWDSVPDASMRILAELGRAECSEAQRDEVLSEKGWRLGQRLPHEHCPHNPGHASGRDPVYVGPAGVYCHSCHSRGLPMVPWGVIRRQLGLANSSDTTARPIMDAVDHLTHYNHAAFLLEHFAPSVRQEWRSVLYRALLKRRHGPTDPRIPLAFVEAWPFVRGSYGWLHKDTLKDFLPKPSDHAFRTFSSACVVGTNKEGELVAVPSEPHTLAHASDGNVPGYFPIARLPPAPIWWRHRKPQMDRGILHLHPPRPPTGGLTYLPRGARMSLEGAEEVLARRFPGINLNYLALLFVARGFGEGSGNELPVIWATGDSGSGKTSTCFLMEEMWDHTPTDLAQYSESEEGKRKEAWGEAQKEGGFVIFDDFAKGAETSKGKSKLLGIMQWLLQMTAAGRNQYHRLWVGSVNVDVTTPILLTDLKMPAILAHNQQIGRRVVLVKLGAPVPSWASQGPIKGWWRKTPELRYAAESWYSEMVDEYFPPEEKTPPDTFVAIARDLGFATLAEAASEERVEIRDRLMRNLFYAVATTKINPAVERSNGRGYHMLSLQGKTPISKAAEELVYFEGETHASDEVYHRIMDEYQSRLTKILPLVCPAVLRIRPYKDQFVVRFEENFGPGKGFRVNADLIQPGFDIESLKPQE
jgi:hypothetical protein